MTKDEYFKIVSDLINVTKANIDEEEDFDKEAQKQILERDKQYSALLRHFVNITKKRNESKEKFKWVYFWIIMGVLIALNSVILATIVVILVKCDANQIVSSIPVLITAIAGFASSIIAIPLTITKYLFSTKEDQYITDIISHTQEHDLSNRKILKELVGKVREEISA